MDANLESPDVANMLQLIRVASYLHAGGVIIDEIQRVPQLVSYIRLLWMNAEAGQFILTGSQQFEVMNTINQSLAGRTALLKLLPFSVSEIESYAF